MREIKFRAWDTKHREMIEEIKIFPEYNWLVQSDNDALCERERASENQLILMQYTGLKDRNGTEIYEGDIVRINIPVDENNPLITNGIFQVIFDKGMFCIFIPEGNYPLSDYLHQDCEVIGNIYEHPELLNQ